jgi:hypothetical protein
MIKIHSSPLPLLSLCCTTYPPPPPPSLIICGCCRLYTYRFLSLHTTEECKEFQEYFYLRSANNRSLVVLFAGTIRVLILPYPTLFLSCCVFCVNNMPFLLVFDVAFDRQQLGALFRFPLFPLLFFYMSACLHKPSSAECVCISVYFPLFSSTHPSQLKVRHNIDG